MSEFRVCFCGTRGLPAKYGGFETAVDEITKRFINAGVCVDVFCRNKNGQDHQAEDHGRRLIRVQGSEFRSLDTFVASIRTGWYLLFHRKEYQHVFWFNNANLPGILLTILARIPTTVNTDGLEWRRQKWSLPFKLYYYFSSWLLTKFRINLISDSAGISKYYLEKFNRSTVLVPYGAAEIPSIGLAEKENLLHKLGLVEKQYFLQITRFEPDNLPLYIANGFKESGLAELGYKLVIVGYLEKTNYSNMLMAMNGTGGILVLPANYDASYLYILRNNCFSYVHGNSVGGTNPALLEAMACCSRIMAIDVVFSKEVIGENGIYFDRKNIDQIFVDSLATRERGELLSQRVHKIYTWDAVASSYLGLAKNGDPTYLLFNEGE